MCVQNEKEGERTGFTGGITAAMEGTGVGGLLISGLAMARYPLLVYNS